MILTNRTFVAVHTGLLFVFQLLATLDKDKMLYWWPGQDLSSIPNKCQVCLFCQWRKLRHLIASSNVNIYLIEYLIILSSYGSFQG